MTKIKNLKNVPTTEELVEGIPNSPYFPIACKMLWQSDIDDPNIGDLLQCYHEIAKVDNKINQKRNKND